MKKNYTRIAAIAASLLMSFAADAQTITVLRPLSSMTCVDYVPVRWVTSETPSNVQIIFTYVSGPASPAPTTPWRFLFNPVLAKSTVGNIIFSPLTALSNSSFAYISPNTVMPDGVYSASMIFVRTINNATVQSSTVTNITLDNTTIPGQIVSPASNAVVNAQFVLKDTTYEMPSSKKILFARGTDTTTLVMANSTKDSFDLNINDLTGSSPSVLSASTNSLADGVYDILLVYKDIYNHDSAVSVTHNVTIDSRANPPSLLAPMPNTTLPDRFTLQYNLPEDAAANGVKLVFDNAGTKDTLTLAATSTGAHSIVIDGGNLSNTTSFVSSTLSSLQENLPYTIGIMYTDKNGNSSPVAAVGGIVIDRHADAPLLHVPASSSNFINIGYTLPEMAQANSFKLIFEKDGSSDTVALSNTLAGDSNVVIQAASIAASTGVASTSVASLSEGTYIVKALYTDQRQNRSPVTPIARMTLDFSTAAPIITFPSDGATVGRNFSIHYSLAEKPLAGTVILQFNSNGKDTTVRLRQTQAGDHVLSMSNNIDSIIAADTSVLAASTGMLGDGTYSVRAMYLDAVGNPAAVSNAVNITLDTQAGSPVITAPSDSATVSSPFDLTYLLPEAAAPNRVWLILDHGGSKDTLTLSATAAGTHTVTIDANNLVRSTGVAASTNGVLANGSYHAVLQYADASGNPGSASTDFTLDNDRITVPPVLLSPASGSRAKDSLTVSFTLPEAALPNSVRLLLYGNQQVTLGFAAAAAGSYTYKISGDRLSQAFGVTNASADTLPAGTYALVLSYQDAKGNPAASTVNFGFGYATSDSLQSPVPVDTTSLPSLRFDISELKGTLAGDRPDVAWKTVAERNTSYYEVQRSTDSVSFASVGTVPAAGMSTSDKLYHFTDVQAGAGTNYYRLRMVDQDNVSVYTPTVSVYRDKTVAGFRVFPVPATTSIYVSVVSPVANASRVISVWDHTGRLVKRMTFNTVQGTNIFAVPLTGFAAGTYILQDGDRVASFIKL